MAEPAVSVIVPARDASATLPQTLAALAATEFAGIVECVVVDDASTDDTAKIAERAGARFDAAVLGAGLAVRRRSVWPLVLAAPCARRDLRTSSSSA